MKKYLLGVFAIALAIGFSAFKASTVELFLTWDPSSISTTNVIDVDSYSTDTPACDEGSTVPCKVDIAPYENAADFIEYLETITLPADRVLEVQARANGNFKS